MEVFMDQQDGLGQLAEEMGEMSRVLHLGRNHACVVRRNITSGPTLDGNAG